jgi:hypothetical protein
MAIPTPTPISWGESRDSFAAREDSPHRGREARSGLTQGGETGGVRERSSGGYSNSNSNSYSSRGSSWEVEEGGAGDRVRVPPCGLSTSTKGEGVKRLVRSSRHRGREARSGLTQGGETGGVRERSGGGYSNSYSYSSRGSRWEVEEGDSGDRVRVPPCGLSTSTSTSTKGGSRQEAREDTRATARRRSQGSGPWKLPSCP